MCFEKSSIRTKQAGRAWSTKLNTVLREIGAQPLNADLCVYRLKRRETEAFILTYVDILVATSSDDLAYEIRRKLRQHFDVRYLDEVHYCLGMEFHRTERGIHINQKGYVDELFKKYGMSDCKPVGTPMDVNIRLNKSEGKSNQEDTKLPYRELVGALNYLAVATQPDISFACSHLR